jgi:hypothetical protein
MKKISIITLFLCITLYSGIGPFPGGSSSGGGGSIPTPVSIPNGGTGQTTAQAAIDALVPAQGSSSGEFLTTDGTNVSWAPAGVSYPLLADAGSAAAPSYAFTGGAGYGDKGLFSNASGSIGIASGGAQVLSVNPGISGGALLSFGSRVYNDGTAGNRPPSIGLSGASGSGLGRLMLNSVDVTYFSTGALGGSEVYTAGFGTNYAYFYVPIIFDPDNSYDIGRDASNVNRRPRSAYLGTDIYIGGTQGGSDTSTSKIYFGSQNTATSYISTADTNLDGSFKAKRLNSAVATLTDGATPALDASLGNTFLLTAAGDRTIGIPSNPVSGQKIVIAHTASGADRTLALNTGAGGFRFGTDITGLTATTSGKTDYIGAIYNASASFWDVVAYTKGF